MKKLLKAKNFVAMILLAVLIIPCAFVLSACDNAPSKVEVSTYDELVSALNGDKDIVKLTSDIDIATELVVSRKVVLDLNGKSIYNTTDIWYEDKEEPSNNKLSIILIKDDGNLTIRGNGSINAKVGDCYGINIAKGTLLVENGTIKGNVSAIQLQEGTVTILDGKFEDQQKWSRKGDTQYSYTLNCIDANYVAGTAKIIVKGGEFVNFNPANCTAEGANTNFVAEGFESVLVEGSTTDYKVVAKAN